MFEPSAGSELRMISQQQIAENEARRQRVLNQMFLIRVTLGLNPIHDPVEAVRVLLEDGREAFEKLRGEPCAHAHQWKV